MKNTAYLVLTFVLIAANSFAQGKKLSFSGYSNPDSSFWYARVYKESLKKSNLTDLTKSKDAFHLRIVFTEIQMLDIWTNDFKTFNGRIINWAQTSGQTPEKFFSEIVPLSGEQAQSVYNLFTDSGISKIPTASQVKGWDDGLDGSEYTIEYSTRNEYSFKEYWTPKAFPKVDQAVAINTFVTKLDKQLKIRYSWNAFIRTLPRYSFYSGGGQATKILGKK